MDFNDPAAFPRSFRAEIATCRCVAPVTWPAWPAWPAWRALRSPSRCCGLSFAAMAFAPCDISHDGSMYGIYMVTSLGYIDGIHVTIYSMDPMGIVNEDLSNGVSYLMDLFIMFHNPLQTRSDSPTAIT